MPHPLLRGGMTEGLNMKKPMLTIAELVKAHDLEVLYAPCALENIFIRNEKIDRNGMKLMGFKTTHQAERLHLMGNMETSYLDNLSEIARDKSIKNFFECGTAGLIITNNNPCDPLIFENAKAYNVVILRTAAPTSEYIYNYYYFTAKYYAKTTTMHGVLVEVHGEGTLITGESSIGKSEVAIGLIMHGHRLIADDSVEIKLMPDKRLIGYPLPLTYGFTELRGLGIINIKELYGLAAMQSKTKITSVVHLVPWNNQDNYDRLGLEEEKIDILGVAIPKITLPVRAGRNMTAIIEAHAVNQRAKRNGYNAVIELEERRENI